MDIWQTSLLIGAVGTALLCHREPRALLWIAVGAMNFVVTAAFETRWPAWHPYFTGFADASVCLAIYFIGRHKWEMMVWRIFQTSVLVSILFIAGLIPSHYAYIAGLEACNWAALVVIGGTQGLRLVDHGMGWNRFRRAHQRLHRLVRALCEKRAKAPFHLSGW